LFPFLSVKVEIVQTVLQQIVGAFDLVLNAELRALSFLYALPLPLWRIIVFILQFLVLNRVSLQLIWCVVMYMANCKLDRMLRRDFAHVQRFYAFTQPVYLLWLLARMAWRLVPFLIRHIRRALVGLLRMYDQVLLQCTRLCHGWGILGDILLIPVSIVWMFWLLYVPYASAKRSLYVPMSILCLMLLVHGRDVIRHGWAGV